jgi:hypothetical protein
MAVIGLSTNTASGTTLTCDWNGGSGMFSVTSNGDYVGAIEIKLEHDLGSEVVKWVDIGPAATFTANGATLFTTSATSLRVVLADSGGPETYHVLVQPTYENKAF